MDKRPIFGLAIFLAFSGLLLSQGCAPTASLVIGQPDFTSNTGNQGLERAANNTLSKPVGPVAIYENALYVADGDNNRIVKFAPVPDKNGATATAIIQSTDATKWLTFADPFGVVIYKGKMFVVDNGNGRVLIWNSVPSGNEPPDVVLGQSDLTGKPIRDCAHLHGPKGIYVRDNRLIVSEQDNSRVLIWNSIPARSDAKNPIAADLILGKSDCSPDDTAQTKHTFNEPRGVWTDGTKLVVADTENNRVLIWSNFPKRPTDDADIVLGTGQPGCTRRQFDGPYAVASDGSNLFVSDSRNNRVLLWDHFPIANGDLPTAVIGQRNFERSGVNEGGNASASGLSEPQGLYYTNDQLWVTDSGNNRVLLFKVKK